MRRLSYCLFILAVFLLAPLLALPRQRQADPAPTAVPTATAAPAAVPYRAVWVSYLEWQRVDFTSGQAFRADIDSMMDNIHALGATVVLAQVRPFGDALLPQRVLSVQPHLHRRAGAEPRL